MISSKAIGQYVLKTYGEPLKKQIDKEKKYFKKYQLPYRKKIAAKGKVVKKHSRVKDLPKSATKHAKGASLLTRRIPGATLS